MNTRNPIFGATLRPLLASGEFKNTRQRSSTLIQEKEVKRAASLMGKNPLNITKDFSKKFPVSLPFQFLAVNG